MGNFADFKKRSKSTTDILEKKLDELKKPSYSKDERIWYPKKDTKTGNGFALIRFLPPTDGEDSPFVRYYSHGFKGPNGSWYIENCPTTIGKPCPVCAQNSAYWNSGIDSDKEIARARKRKELYVSNILVLKDPDREENEGKVFLYQYGRKIFSKINACMHPEFPGDQKVDPFNAWTGKDFKLKIKTIGEYSNYDDSVFVEACSPIGTDEYIETIWRKQYPLLPFIDPSVFKSPEELQARFDEVVGKASTSSQSHNTQQKASEPVKETKRSAPVEESDEGESALDYFKKQFDND